MRNLIKISIVLSLMIVLMSCNQKKQTFHLTGEVKDPNIESLILIEVNKDMRFDSIIDIEVNNGKFDYKFNYDYPRAYNLMLGKARENGGGRFMPIFLEKSDSHLVIYPEENFEKNIVNGGNLNEEYKDFRNGMDSIIKKRPNMKFEDQLDFWNSYVEKNPTIVSYYLFFNILSFQEYVDIDESKVKRLYNNLEEAHEGHPYNKIARNLLSASGNIKIGKKYVDFSAPKLNGDTVRLSDQIDGKLALVDLWATWCGPCIKKTRAVLPLYEKYKDKGFTIVGVAGEFKTTERLEKFLKNEQWPWVNLVELDRDQNIWQKYGVDGGGGGMFLIDENGKFIAIDTDVSQIEKELEERLN